jgi:hypothetical protein
MARSDTTKSSTPKETGVAQSKALTVVETTKVPFLQRVKLVPVERKNAPKDADPVSKLGQTSSPASRSSSMPCLATRPHQRASSGRARAGSKRK